MLMAFWLPIERTFFPIAIWIWIGTWILEGDLRKKLKHSFNNKYHKSIFIIVCIFYAIHIIGLLHTENISKGMVDLQLKIIMLLFVIAMAGLNEFYKKKPYHIPASFLSGTFVISLITLIIGIIKGFSNLSPNIQNLNFIHHTYISMYVNFSVILSFYFFEKHIIIKPRGIWLIITVFFGMVIWLLQSRAGIIIYALTIISWIIYKSQKLNYLKFFSLSLIVIILGMSIFFISKNKRFEPILNMISNYSYSQQKTTVKKNIPIRIKIWNSSFNIIQKNWLIGVGTGDVKKELIKIYESKGYWVCYANHFNTHNQFLGTFVKLGIIGFILLIFMIFVPLYYSIKRKYYLLTGFLFLIIFYWLIESMLLRLSGIAFFVLFYNYLIFNDYHLKQQRLEF